ncbi:DUF1641 domain-containing protein [Halothiobacillus sp.]|uniref:DUF1641 domain-containing protein n=1 Tax=Halothiobacillus sp. TaxID=1891311 RepID=UPI002AD3C9D8|nr:DUF1641 domain-containing protein [Halothiobacillus sp.]
MSTQLGPETGALTPEQWQGLAQLGDLGNKIGLLFDGPLAGVTTSEVNRLGDLAAHYDLPALGEHLIETLDACERAGLLRLIRENAAFIASSLETLQPLMAQWMVDLNQMPVDDLKADVASLFTTLRRMRHIGEFIETQLGGELTAGIVHGSAFLERNATDQALVALLELLGRLYRNGTLASLGDLTDYLAGLDEGTDPQSLAGNLVQNAPHRRLEQLIHLVHSAEEAMEGIEADDPHLGGIGGLVHLLRDKEVQKGLRMLSVLPAYMSRRKRNAVNTH